MCCMGPTTFPRSPQVCRELTHMVGISPSGGSKGMQLIYLLSIMAAAQLIDLSAAYFIPDEMTTQPLVAALERGVKLRVIVPGEHIDCEAVRSASPARWRQAVSASNSSLRSASASPMAFRSMSDLAHFGNISSCSSLT